MIWFIIGLALGIGAGWYLKGKFGPVVADIKDTVDHHPV